MLNSLHIRPAIVQDATGVAPLLVQAMGSLAGFFTGHKGMEIQLNLFEYFFSLPANQYSFENTMVAMRDDSMAGMCNAYDGANLAALRQPFFAYIQTNFGVTFPETDDETEAGEYYIDCVSVHPHFQGQGIGTQLLQAVNATACSKGFAKTGLLVEAGNHRAFRLYERMGFRLVGKKYFMGGHYAHMQCML